MSNALFKIRVLLMMFRHVYEEWRKDVWQRDLDSSYCCSGYECGCQATSVRDLYSWHMEK